MDDTCHPISRDECDAKVCFVLSLSHIIAQCSFYGQYHSFRLTDKGLVI